MSKMLCGLIPVFLVKNSISFCFGNLAIFARQLLRHVSVMSILHGCSNVAFYIA